MNPPASHSSISPWTSWLAVVTAAALVFGVGCAGSPKGNPPPPSAGSFSSEGGLRFGDSAISNNAIDGLLAESAPPATPAAPAKSKRSRPGLATQAGSDRWSVVEDAVFFRKSAGQPDAVDSFHYNDAEGARAMADALGGARKKEGSFDAAGHRLEVSVRPGGWDRPFERYEAAGRRIVIGSSGGAYQIVLRNRMNHAIEVVASVDGLDVLDGKTASVKKRGYIIQPRETLTVDGFRKDNRTIQQFVFGSVDASLASKSGGSRNVGVIGLAVYDEDEAQAQAARLAEARQRQGASAFPAGAR